MRDHSLLKNPKYFQEQLNAANGITHVLRTCYTKGKAYQFDDGVTMSNLNQCVTRTTRQGQYYVALCTTQDMCNNDCKTQTQPTLPPVNPTPLLGSVTCYECSTNDGTDCQTNTCEGAYCLYGMFFLIWRRVKNALSAIMLQCQMRRSRPLSWVSLGIGGKNSRFKNFTYFRGLRPISSSFSVLC